MDFTWTSHRSRTACAQSFAAKALRAHVTAAKPQEAGRFIKTASVQLPPRAPAERAERREEVIQARCDKYIEETKSRIATLQASQSQVVQNLQEQIEKKNKELLDL
jgi:hypothetical protein